MDSIRIRWAESYNPKNGIYMSDHDTAGNACMCLYNTPTSMDMLSLRRESGRRASPSELASLLHAMVFLG
jgi:hypothetical protein